jgi:KaiC/GvpD/RAD55 family RecA-like ATPase
MTKDAAEKSKTKPKKTKPEEKDLITEEIFKDRKKKLKRKIDSEEYKKEEEKILKKKKLVEGYIRIGIAGLDELFEKGLPKGNSVLIAGGAGTGKTILCLQILCEAAKNGEKCLYLSFEEAEDKLKQHMRDFGWNVDEFEKKGLLKIKRVEPFDISRSIEALLAKAKGELMIETSGLSDFIPEGFKPNRVVIDSVTALTSAFVDKDSSYRAYIEQSFRYLEKIGATSFLISESWEVPQKFSKSGVEEFLADGIIAFYNIRKGNVRERAIEIIKMRGAEFEERVVALKITDKGIIIYPEQEVFGGIEKE